MPRPARFDQDAILDAALRVVAARGPSGMTIDAVAEDMKGHIGSIYYRFPTKDHVLAQLWMRCARIGQAGMITALATADVERALDAGVLHYPRWSRRDLAAAKVLAAYGREQIAPHCPAELSAELRTVNDKLITAVATFTARYYDNEVTAARRRAVTFALLDLPSSAIRRYLLAGRPPPKSLDVSILAAARAALSAVGR